LKKLKKIPDMNKEIILLKLAVMEKELGQLRQMLSETEIKTTSVHNCNDNAELVFDFKNQGTSNSAYHRCKICGARIIPFNDCTTNANVFSTLTGANYGNTHFAGKPSN